MTTAAVGRELRVAIGISLALALLAAPFLAAVFRNAEPTSMTDKNEAVAGIEVPGAPPLAGGHEVSIDEAVRQSEVPIYRPDAPLASDEGIRDVWQRSGDNSQVFIRYRSGIILTIQPSLAMPSNREWAEELVGDGIDGRIEDISGVEAFVVQQHLPSLGSVRFFLGDSLVVIVGDGDFPAENLRTLAVSTIERAQAIDAEKAAIS